MGIILDYEIKKCSRDDVDYPNSFRNYRRLPDFFYYIGDISVVNKNKNVAVIGSRKCPEKDLKFAREIGRATALEGINLVNGLAIGCDTEAIRGALEEGGICVAVMPGGLNQVYPKSNMLLANEIVEKGGCLISEYEKDFVPQKFTFVERDRLQSALSQGVFVVAAEISGGTLHTVQSAAKQYKRIGCYAYELSNMEGNQYIKEKYGAREVTDLEQYREFLNEINKDEIYTQMTLFDYAK